RDARPLELLAPRGAAVRFRLPGEPARPTRRPGLLRRRGARRAKRLGLAGGAPGRRRPRLAPGTVHDGSAAPRPDGRPVPRRAAHPRPAVAGRRVAALLDRRRVGLAAPADPRPGGVDAPARAR